MFVIFNELVSAIEKPEKYFPFVFHSLATTHKLAGETQIQRNRAEIPIALTPSVNTQSLEAVPSWSSKLRSKITSKLLWRERQNREDE